jgi:hypothetical protein
LKVQNFEFFIQTFHPHVPLDSKEVKLICTLLSLYSFSWIKTSKLYCCIKPIDSSGTFCQSSNFQLFCLNSIYESRISIWHFSLLEFCYKLLMCLCTSLSMLHEAFYGLQVSFCPQMSLFWLRDFYKCYKLLIYLMCTQIDVDGNTIFHFLMYYNLI